jgi:ATP-binding cassette subfamily B protein
MNKLIKTCHTLIKGHETVYWLSLFAQILMIIASIFTSFLIKVLADTLDGIDALNNAKYVEVWIIALITGGRGNQYLIDNMATILPVAIVVSAVISALTSLLRMGMRSYVAAVINGSMQLAVFDHLERLPYSYYKRNKSGDLIQTCTRDLDVIRKFLIGDVSNFNYTFWVVLFCFAILMSISWRLTTVSLALFPVMFLYSFFLIKEVRRRYRETDDSEGQDDRQDLRKPRCRPHRQSLQCRKIRNRFF